MGIIAFIAACLIVGVLLGGKTITESIRKGCGCYIILVLIIAFAFFMAIALL